MNTVENILNQARQRGLFVEPVGQSHLFVWPSALLSPEFAAVLRANKPALLAFLNAGHTAKQVLAGEFADADNELIQTVAGILNASSHPLAHPALIKLFSITEYNQPEKQHEETQNT